MNRNKRKITSAVLLASAVWLAGCSSSENSKKVPSADEIETIASTEPETEETTDALPADWASMYEFVPSEKGISGKAKQWMKLNKDYIGWLKINDTLVNYPIMLDPGETEANDPIYGPEGYVPNAFYLDHYWDRTSFRDGIPYMDWKDDFEGSLQSENLVIYGHNMADGSMFGSVRRYRQDYDFYYQSPFVQLSSRYNDYDYVIFAFLVTPGSYTATDFHYWDMEELDTKKEFDSYVQNCRGHQMIDTGVDVQYGDQLLTLSTCYADYDNSRFIIVARRLRDGESADDLNTVQRTPEYLKEHPELKKYQPDYKGDDTSSDEKPEAVSETTPTENGVDTVNE